MLNLDVFTAEGWKKFEADKNTLQREEAVELSSEEEEEQEARAISLILQGTDKLKVRVLETVTIQQLINVYRGRANIPSHKTISIFLDGDVLLDDQTIEELDLDDGDILDVEIKN